MGGDSPTGSWDTAGGSKRGSLPKIRTYGDVYLEATMDALAVCLAAGLSGLALSTVAGATIARFGTQSRQARRVDTILKALLASASLPLSSMTLNVFSSISYYPLDSSAAGAVFAGAVFTLLTVFLIITYSRLVRVGWVTPSRRISPMRPAVWSAFVVGSLTVAIPYWRYLGYYPGEPSGEIRVLSSMASFVGAFASALVLFVTLRILLRARQSRLQALRIEHSIAEEKAGLVEKGPTLEQQMLRYERSEYARIMELLDSGDTWAAVGLVGIRGTGKSMLQTQVLQTCREGGAIAFSVSCPTHIDEREVVVNLFDRLCYAVLKRISDDLGDSVPALIDFPSVRSMSGLASLGRFLRALLYAAVSVGAGAAAMLLLPTATAATAVLAGAVVTAAAGVATYLASGLFVRGAATLESRVYLAAQDPTDPGKALKVARAYVMAKRHLMDLETEQRLKSGAEAGIAPLSFLTFRFGRSQEITRRTMTLPGLIDAFIDFVSIGVAPCYGRVVIAIDELDRVIDPQEVRAFLRRIKALLAVPGVFYIMSVSEDVVESFELHSISAKGEADSAFSDVVRLRPLSVAECLSFLHVTGRVLSDREAIALAVLSAGIPRDLVRYVRKYQSWRVQLGSPASQDCITGFLSAERGEAIESFIAHVRYSEVFGLEEKERVVSFLQATPAIPPLLRSYLQSGSLAGLCPAPGSVDERTEERKHLLLCLLVRLATMDSMLEAGDAIVVSHAEQLRRALECHSFSPLEAVHALLGSETPARHGQSS